MVYQPGRAPKINSLDDLVSYLDTELLAVARSQTEFDVLQLIPQYREPVRPRPGMLAYADGTDWNPGDGEGVYVLNLSNTWVKL